MSGGRYRNLETFSPSGRYKLTAHSPDNLPGGHGFARNFEYRMWNEAGDLCWERTAPVGEPSPIEIVVSDDGFAVLHLHSQMHFPRVLAIDPKGLQLLELAVAAGPLGKHWDGLLWIAREMVDSTAGDYWTIGSWSYFTENDGRPHFVCRARSGQRLVLRLAGELAVVDEGEIATGVFQAEEIDCALRFLAQHTDTLCALEPESADLWALDLQFGRCLCLLAEHLPVQSLKWLQRLESYRAHGFTTKCYAFGRDVEFTLGPRPRVKALLRRMNAPTSGYPTYDFVSNGEKLASPHLQQPDLEKLTIGLTATQVLEAVGSPDFIHQQYKGVGKWNESWEFDHYRDGWLSLRIKWDVSHRLPVVQSVLISALDWKDRENHLRSGHW